MLGIRYINEHDRSMGLSGMAITLAVYDNEGLIMDIDLDRTSEPIALSHEFYFSGNPRFSAKSVWGDMARRFHLAMAMAMGNMLSRSMQRREIFGEDDRKALKELICNEGAETCGLEPDEIEVLWNKDYNYLRQVFRHPTIQQMARTMAHEIEERRVLSRHEILELLDGI